MAEIIQFPFKHGRDFHQSLFVLFLWEELGLQELEPKGANAVAVGLYKQLDTLTDTQLAQAMRKFDSTLLRESPEDPVDTAS
jgi:hypothetical protein